MTTKIIQKTSLADEVMKQLQQQIVSGKYPKGSQLPTETQLMKEFGVGRSSIREAVKTLANTGILRVQQGVGTFVEFKNGAMVPWYVRLQHAKAYELNEVRQLLELKIAEKAAINRTAKDISRLKKLLQQRHAAALRNQADECIDADILFHIAIAEAAKNNILADLYKTIAAQIKRSFKEAYHDTDTFLAMHGAHEALLKNIIDKDPKKASQSVGRIIGTQPIA